MAVYVTLLIDKVVLLQCGFGKYMGMLTSSDRKLRSTHQLLP